MYLPIQGFISSFRLLDILDILLVAFVLYKLFILIRNTRAVALVKGLLILGAVTIVSKVLDLHVINWMLQQGMTVILVALPVVFQPELRRALEQIGRGRFFSFGAGYWHGRAGTTY
jgi:diadenylate cyclase